jgi:hypothetical protein
VKIWNELKKLIIGFSDRFYKHVAEPLSSIKVGNLFTESVESVNYKKKIFIVTYFGGAGIAQLWAAWLWIWVPVGAVNFSPHYWLRPALWPTQPPVQRVRGALSLGLKWLGHEAEHSPPSSAEVKHVWSYTSTPPACLHGVVLS